MGTERVTEYQGRGTMRALIRLMVCGLAGKVDHESLGKPGGIAQLDEEGVIKEEYLPHNPTEAEVRAMWDSIVI